MTTLEAIKKYGWPYSRTKVCELTLNYECNARCVFCYSSPEMEEWKNKNSLDVKTAASYMLGSYKSGARILQAIGGEPTIYAKLPEVLKIAKKIGYPAIQIVTNGQKMAHYGFAKKLALSGLNSVTFSVHSCEASLHDKIVGVEGAFINMLKAIENALNLGLYITVGTAINSYNYKNIPSLLKFLYENFRIESYHLIAMHFIGGARKDSQKIKTTYTETLPYLKKALAYLSQKKVLPISPILSNYQPCLLPGFEHLISDWKYPFSDDDLYLPEKVYKESMYKMITDALRMKGENCKDCIYEKICAGFEKEYFKMYGDKEFRPLKAVARPFPLPVFYGR